MINIRNKTGDVTTDTIDAKMIIRKCYEQLFTHKFDNLDEIHPFLEKYKLPQLTQYKIYNLKNSVTIKEIEFVIFKTHPPTKSLQAQIVSQRILPHVLTPTFHDLFQGMEEEKTLLNSFYKASIIPLSKPDKDSTEQGTNFLHECRCKNPQQIPANIIKQLIKIFIHHNLVGFIPGVQEQFDI